MLQHRSHYSSLDFLYDNCKRHKPKNSVPISGKNKIVKLTKDPGIGFGLTITCGNTLDSILFGTLIESIEPGGPAQKEGSLKRGDRIISVNGEIVEDVHYLDVVDMIQNSPSNIELIVESQSESTEHLSKEKENIPNGSKVEYDTKNESTKTYNQQINSWSKYVDHPAEDKFNQCYNDCLKANNKEPPIPKPRKKWSEKLEAQTTNHSDDDDDKEINKEEKIAISNTIDSSTNLVHEPEERNVNEILLENNFINDLEDEVFQRNETENVDLHINSKNSIQDENELSNPDNSFVKSEEYMAGDIFCVKLKKIEGSLGLNIQPKDMLVPGLVCVCSLVPNGSAEIDGRIKPGDKLLEVNGVRLDSVPYCEAVNLLRLSPEVSNIVVQRGNFIALDENCANVTKQVDEILCHNNTNHHESIVNSNTLETNMKKWQVRYKKDSSTKIASSLEQIMPDKILPSDSNKNENFGSAKYESSFTEQQQNSTSRSDKVSVLLSQNNDNNTCLEDDHASCDTSSGISTGSSSLFTSVHEERNVLSELPVISHRSGVEKYATSTPNNKQNYQIMRTITNKNYNNNNGCVNDGNDVQQSYQNTKQVQSNFYHNGCEKVSVTASSEECLQNTVNGSCSSLTKEESANKANRCTPIIPQRRFRQLRKVEDIYKFITPENTFVVHIRKSSRGLGLSICGGRDARNKSCINQLIRVRKLYPLQPAMECENLQVGDVIIEVNGKSTLGLSHSEALDALRAAPTDVMLKIHHPDSSVIPNLPLSMRDDSCPSFSLESPSSSATSTLVKSHSVDSLFSMEFEIVLIKREGSLGFTVVKRESDKDNIPGHYVKELIREPAISDGRIRPGDRILQVNGTDISEMSHNEAVNFLRNSPQEVTLKLCRSDPPLSPLSGDEEPHLTKPLRREAVELLTDWAKQKRIDSPIRKRDRRRVRSKVDDSFSSSQSSSGSHHSSYNHKNNVYASDSDHNVLSECTSEEELSKDEPGLQRILRPKSLDILNASNRKKLTLLNSTEDEVGNLYRQTSVALPGIEQQALSSSPHLNKKTGQGTLLRWRGTTLPKTESNHNPDSPIAVENNILIQSNSSTENNPDDALSFSFNIEIIEVSLDRGWHGRLGFSICDPANDNTEESVLPNSPEVKIVHAGSLAATDGRIKAGDRLIQVNKENVEGKAAVEVIDILRKTRGLVTMIFARMKKPNDLHQTD